jgi:signal transduction histidine kinase
MRHDIEFDAEGGALGVHSPPGAGTTVSCQFPLTG